MKSEFDIIKVFERTAVYKARSWNRQYLRKYLLKYDNIRIIECALIKHYRDDESHDLTLELSNMYNCVVGCSFCASGNLPYSCVKLKASDYVRQVKTILYESGEHPEFYNNFRISFYGIGEPSVVYREISDAIVCIRRSYPYAKFNIATFGFRPDCFAYWINHTPDLYTVQIPYYSCNQEKLRSIVRNLPKDYSFEKVLREASQYQRRYTRCRLKINYIVIADFNDNKEELSTLMRLLVDYKSRISVRVSYLNETKASIQKGYHSANDAVINEIITTLRENGYDCYVFGPLDRTDTGCGQLLQEVYDENITPLPQQDCRDEAI